jgi:hypothetical protein
VNKKYKKDLESWNRVRIFTHKIKDKGYDRKNRTQR